MRWHDSASGKSYLTLEETERARRSEAAARELTERGRKAETAARKAAEAGVETEAAAREFAERARRAAEVRIADLQARLARLSHGPGGGEDR